MGTEIERKFLVKSGAWRTVAAERKVLRQGYLATGDGNTVRIRTDGVRAWLTVKGPTRGLRRAEFEYEVPVRDGLEMLALCGSRVVEKTRSCVPIGRHMWEIDEFSGPNAGLILAEVELAEENENVGLPEWLGREVTGDRRFDNASLSSNPYQLWTAAERQTATG